MFFWLMILISLIFAYMGFKKGFFVTFAILFNLMFAIFVGVLSTPKLLSMNTGYEQSGYYAAASILLLVILIFTVLQFFAYFYFLRDSDGLFPKLFDKAGAVILGFLCGYIICAVLLLSFSVMPCSAKARKDSFYSRDQFINLSEKPVEKVCGFLGWYSLHCFERESEDTITNLLALAEEAPANSVEEGAYEGLTVPEILEEDAP